METNKKIKRYEFVLGMIEKMPLFDLYYKYNKQTDPIDMPETDFIDWMNKFLDYVGVNAKVVPTFYDSHERDDFEINEVGCWMALPEVPDDK